MKRYFSDAQRQLNLVASGGILQKFKTHPSFYEFALVTYKHEDDQMKNEGATAIKLYSHILDAQGQRTLQLVVGIDEN